MEESILKSIKKLLGLSENYTVFDPDIIMHINTVLMNVKQLGIGPSKGFRIEDDLAVWNDLIDNDDYLDGVKTYIHLKVKLLFDPPLNSSTIEAMQKQIDEIEWRLNLEVESKNKE